MSDEQRFLGGVDGLGGEVLAVVDLEDAVDLGDEAVGESEVAVGGADDGGDRRCVRQTVVVGVGCWESTTASGKLVFGIFAAVAEFERELIFERTLAGLASARARGRNGGRPYKMTPAKLRLAMASMGKPGTKVSDLCTELGITRQTLYRHVSPTGELRPDGEKLISNKAR
ncbi:recombinase family protein [Arthrobacter sp. 92]|uniref:recombinase family protein n=1 Tax=Arthrobacter sp. 92 TaxID=3418175 RepID=UPI003D07625D